MRKWSEVRAEIMAARGLSEEEMAKHRQELDNPRPSPHELIDEIAAEDSHGEPTVTIDRRDVPTAPLAVIQPAVPPVGHPSPPLRPSPRPRSVIWNDEHPLPPPEK